MSPYRLSRSALRNLSTCPLQVSFTANTSKLHSSAFFELDWKRFVDLKALYFKHKPSKVKRFLMGCVVLWLRPIACKFYSKSK